MSDATDGLAFTMEAYADLVTSLLDDGYRFTDYANAAERTVVMRHDVDLSVERALAMARLEADLGVTSTYFFLVTAPVYNLVHPETRAAVEEIAALGCDVGLHFDTHHYWDDRPAEAELVERVRAETESLERVVGTSVETVSFHVPPEWVLNRAFDSFVNAYAPRYFEEPTYVSDSNQKWRAGPPFPDGVPERVQILVHPGLWHEDDRPLAEVLRTVEERTHDGVARFMAPLGE
ncbi:hypothetical protein [Halomarina ordinaria]|uniref:Polysaccharide deacetylase family protein n=1 Tax=Halomarina ordinaria TaxID=3033939 RepID=A0ABD5UAB6_9EURY|nr:hypothetical protein [Halomarina sp. PSRA2]